MGWRVRRSVKLMPGVRLNFTENGISATSGAHTTFSRGRVTNTVGVPGTVIHVDLALAYVQLGARQSPCRLLNLDDVKRTMRPTRSESMGSAAVLRSRSSSR